MAIQTIDYAPTGVCSTRITVRLDDSVVREVVFENGCSGNTQGISRLVVGMTAQEVLRRLRGIDCDGKGTSCPDQLAQALEQHCAQRQA